MNRNLLLSLGVLAFAISPALAQQAAAPAAGELVKVHGRITNPTGAPQSGGTITYVNPAHPDKDAGVFTIDSQGNYTGEVPAGTYTIIYRGANMEKDKEADRVENVKVVAGADNVGDDDMSRQAYIDKLPAEQKKELEDLRKKNSEALKANEVIKALNTDLRSVAQDLKEVDGAHTAAAQQLGATASKSDVEAKVNEIKSAKYTDIETMMTKDTEMRPTEPVLWAYLGQAQVGLKKYDDAITSYKKALETDAAAKKPNPAVEGMANSGLGEIYARTGKAADANAAYEAAAKANPTSAGMYYRNQAVIFFQQGNAEAQVAAADTALKNDPNDALLYYLKGQGLVNKATIDPKTQRIVLPDDCTAAYQKYLDLAPTGPYAAEVQGILQQAGQKVTSSYKAAKPSKK